MSVKTSSGRGSLYDLWISLLFPLKWPRLAQKRDRYPFPTSRRGLNHLPPTIPGKLSPARDPCDSAVKERYTDAAGRERPISLPRQDFARTLRHVLALRPVIFHRFGRFQGNLRVRVMFSPFPTFSAVRPPFSNVSAVRPPFFTFQPYERHFSRVPPIFTVA